MIRFSFRKVALVAYGRRVSRDKSTCRKSSLATIVVAWGNNSLLWARVMVREWREVNTIFYRV